MSSLVPCPSCRRHLRVSEVTCPFCRSMLPSTLANAVVPAATQRLTRAAAFAFTATLALSGCSDAIGPGDGGVAPLYGAPADVSSTDTGTPTDNPVATDRGTPTDNPVATDRPVATDTPTMTDTGGPVAAYGAPPDRDAGPSPGDGGVAPLYGAVPAPDAGPDDVASAEDGGGVMPLYGAVPAPDSGTVSDTGGGGIRYGAPPPQDWDC